MHRIEKFFVEVSEKLNTLASISVIVVMIITVVDVLLRRFMMPIPGAYDLISLISSFIISFSLGYTSVQKGHIAVEFIFQKLPEKAARIVASVNDLCVSVFCAVVCWQSLSFAIRSMRAGEVSPTIKMPFYPFIFGIAIGAFLLSIVLFVNFLRELRLALRK